jgi:hypothetical protein
LTTGFEQDFRLQATGFRGKATGGRLQTSDFRLQGIPMYIGTGFRLQATEDVR